MLAAVPLLLATVGCASTSGKTEHPAPESTGTKVKAPCRANAAASCPTGTEYQIRVPAN